MQDHQYETIYVLGFVYETFGYIPTVGEYIEVVLERKNEVNDASNTGHQDQKETFNHIAILYCLTFHIVIFSALYKSQCKIPTVLYSSFFFLFVALLLCRAVLSFSAACVTKKIKLMTYLLQNDLGEGQNTSLFGLELLNTKANNRIGCF